MTGLRDISPELFYASLHPGARTPRGGDAEPQVHPQRPCATGELAVDASGLDGVAVLASGPDGCAGRVRMPRFTCPLGLNPDPESWTTQQLEVRPAPGAEPGAHGVLRYRLATRRLWR
ncbi:hypothetical protein ACFQVC_09145 [Streptomyces monticola]|uniref:Uncharacterized protein n=1 Tax=Streptomyces monticola TaxID=2666263 RepID=A0ABW2JFR2_9ACTN